MQTSMQSNVPISSRAAIEEELANVLYKWFTWERKHRRFRLKIAEGEIPVHIAVPLGVRMRLQQMVDREKYLGH